MSQDWSTTLIRILHPSMMIIQELSMFTRSNSVYKDRIQGIKDIDDITHEYSIPYKGVHRVSCRTPKVYHLLVDQGVSNDQDLHYKHLQY